MRRENTKTRKFDAFRLFIALYIIGFVGAALIGLLRSSLFSYKVFDSLWAKLLYVFFLSILYVTAFVQDTLASHKPLDVVINVLIYIVPMMLAIFGYFFTYALILVTILYSAIIACVLFIKAMLRSRMNPDREVNAKTFLSVAILLLFAMVRLTKINYVDETYLAWSLIPTAVLFCIVGVSVFLLMRKHWANMYHTTVKRVGNAVLLAVVIFIGAFFYSSTFIEAANYVFDGEPTPTEFVVLDKKVLSDTHSPTEFEVKIQIGGKEEWITVAAVDYYEIAEGDTITVDYYKGALGFPYWKYSGKN